MQIVVICFPGKGIGTMSLKFYYYYYYLIISKSIFWKYYLCINFKIFIFVVFIVIFIKKEFQVPVGKFSSISGFYLGINQIGGEFFIINLSRTTPLSPTNSFSLFVAWCYRNDRNHFRFYFSLSINFLRFNSF